MIGNDVKVLGFFFWTFIGVHRMVTNVEVQERKEKVSQQKNFE